MEKTGKLGPEVHRERNEGDLRRDAGVQESVQPELQQQTEEREDILTGQQDEEQEEEEALTLAQFMEGKKNIKYVLTLRN